jgi:hypothetical protein
MRARAWMAGELIATEAPRMRPLTWLAARLLTTSKTWASTEAFNTAPGSCTAVTMEDRLVATLVAAATVTFTPAADTVSRMSSAAVAPAGLMFAALATKLDTRSAVDCSPAELVTTDCVARLTRLPAFKAAASAALSEPLLMAAACAA